ncbi:Trans-aconitate 2-methyltransferase [bacterium HR08]|nr:Trans-aconitate 2-methyltransferase [bacterium HR08]
MMSGSLPPDYNEMWTQVYSDLSYKGPTHRHLRRLVAKMLHDIEYESVLDVGCGPGIHWELLARGRKLKRYTGVDISAWALERARELTGGEYYLLDIQKERLDGHWDLVFCSLVLEHLPDDVAALRNMHAMTGKYFLVTTIAGDFERYRRWDERVGHARNYRLGELEQKAAAVGFKVRRTIYWGFPFYSPIVRSLQNYCQIGIGSFNWITSLLATSLYWLYFLNSDRRGDVLVLLAEV